MTWIVVAAASVAAGLVQTLTGFGAVVVLMLVLPFFFDMLASSALALTVSQVFCMVLFWRYRKDVRFRTALPPTLAYAAVNLLLLPVVGRLDLQWMEIALAVFLILLSLYYLLVVKKLEVRPHAAAGIVCGIISGAMSAFFAIGGPPMALYFVAATDSYNSYIGNIQLLFVVTNLIGIAGRVAGGLYDLSILPYALVGTVCMLLGMQLGKQISDRLNGDRIRTITYLFVGVSGLILLLQNLL